MKARIRSVKPDIGTHEELWELGVKTGYPVFQSFVMLWCCADREGRFEWKPRALKLFCVPYWEGDFGALLNELAEAGFVTRYQVDGKDYGVIDSFKKHQVINQREAQSVIPGPGDVTHVRAHASPSVSTAVHVPPKVRKEIFHASGQKCQRCGSKDKLTIGHIFPLSMGGNHAPSNLRTLCMSCNSARPTSGKALVDDLARDGLTMGDMSRMCMHVRAHACTDDATFPSLPFHSITNPDQPDRSGSRDGSPPTGVAPGEHGRPKRSAPDLDRQPRAAQDAPPLRVEAPVDVTVSAATQKPLSEAPSAKPESRSLDEVVTVQADWEPGTDWLFGTGAEVVAHQAAEEFRAYHLGNSATNRALRSKFRTWAVKLNNDSAAKRAKLRSPFKGSTLEPKGPIVLTPAEAAKWS